MRRHLSSPLLKQPGLFTCLLGIFAVSAGLVLPAFAQSSAAPKKAVPAKVTVKKNKTSNAGVADFTKDGFPNMLSSAVMVFDQATGRPLFAKNAETAVPIASITKLMTAIIVLEAKQNLDEPVVIDQADVDTLKNTRSRLPVGTAFRREDLMRLALMASENRAAAALGRAYPGGFDAAVKAMNTKAQSIGLQSTTFVDTTGLAPGNVASAQDLALMVAEASKYSQIREFSTTPELYVTLPNSKHPLGFNNTNALVKSQGWNIGVSKTGFINEAGKCLVMQVVIGNNPVIIVLMDSWGKLTRIGDANRIKKWIESGKVVISQPTPSVTLSPVPAASVGVTAKAI
ncbi:MAG: D-alanyl-D-alanine endopeptidase [Burkholderiales bacterium]|jgi:D-alanyl-D-alanine endopeptidase (penicillin-binding protein 7)